MAQENVGEVIVMRSEIMKRDTLQGSTSHLVSLSHDQQPISQTLPSLGVDLDGSWMESLAEKIEAIALSYT
jgi:hypothetical protein